MNSFKIRYILLNLNGNILCGVYAADQLKLVNQHSFAIVANIAKSTSTGLHWVAFVKTKGQKYIEFMDSFGFHRSVYGDEFINFIKSRGGLLRYNIKQIQSNHSTVCGNFCCMFIKKRLGGESFNSIINSFVDNLPFNDQIVNKFVKQIKLPKFSDCAKECDNECFKDNKIFSTVCVQKNSKCYRLRISV